MEHTMKRILFILAVFPLIASAQTQTFNSVARFATNVFLHDSTTPLHLRVPTNAVIDGVTSTNGSVTVTTNAGVVNLQVANIDASGWSGFIATNPVTLSEIRSGSTSFGATPSNIVFRTVASGGVAGRVLVGSGVVFAAEQDLTLTTTNASGVVLIRGRETGQGGDAAGSVVIRGGIGVGVADGTVTVSNGQYYGNAANLTNFPATLVTVSAANTNYYRFTDPPESNTAFGLPHQIAYNSTNIFIYHAVSQKWGRATLTLEW